MTASEKTPLGTSRFIDLPGFPEESRPVMTTGLEGAHSSRPILGKTPLDPQRNFDLVSSYVLPEDFAPRIVDAGRGERLIKMRDESESRYKDAVLKFFRTLTQPHRHNLFAYSAKDFNLAAIEERIAKTTLLLVDKKSDWSEHGIRDTAGGQYTAEERIAAVKVIEDNLSDYERHTVIHEL